MSSSTTEKNLARQQHSQLRLFCVGKLPYPNARAAYQNGGDIYLCKQCGKWHRASAADRTAAKLERRFL
jgi:hypothetical protein